MGEGDDDNNYTDYGYRLWLWSVSERREIRRFPRTGGLEGSRFVNHAVFSPDGTKVVADLGVFDTATGALLATFRDRKFANNQLASFTPNFFSHDGRQVITAEAEGARFWDIATGKEVRWAIRSKFQVDSVSVGGLSVRSLLPAVMSHDGRFHGHLSVLALFQRLGERGDSTRRSGFGTWPRGGRSRRSKAMESPSATSRSLTTAGSSHRAPGTGAPKTERFGSGTRLRAASCAGSKDTWPWSEPSPSRPTTDR